MPSPLRRRLSPQPDPDSPNNRQRWEKISLPIIVAIYTAPALRNATTTEAMSAHQSAFAIVEHGRTPEVRRSTAASSRHGIQSYQTAAGLTHASRWRYSD
jgi:hypothetical protein